MPYTIIMWAVVLLVLVPACFRSPAALVLFAWWSADMIVWFALGDVPAGADLVLDLAAMLLLFRFVCCYAEILVLVLFMPALSAHAVLDPYNDWLVSWIIGIVQFLLVGYSALRGNTWIEHRMHRRVLHDDIAQRFAVLAGRPV